MFDNLLRWPASPAELVADVLRALGLLSVLIAVVAIGGTAVPLFALVLLGQVVSRFLGVRPALDTTVSVVLLVAGWSNPLELYRGIANWDLVMHFAANGLVAVIAFLLFMRLTSAGDGFGVSGNLRPSAAVTIVTASFGISAGVIWEVGEWFGHTFIDTGIVVEYTDTIGDLAVGALGSLVAGLAMPYLASSPAPRPTPERPQDLRLREP